MQPAKKPSPAKKERTFVIKWANWLWHHPPVLLLVITAVLLLKIILMGQLVYGDIPFFDVGSSQVNFLYAWGSEQFGTPVRQGLNTLRDAVILLFSWHNNIYYFIKYVLPILLVPLVYYFVLHRLGVRNKPALLIGSMFPLCTPIVFGDFLTGQTFWIYLTIPFVFYYAIKIFCHKQFIFKNYILLGIWLFLSLGMLPPIIVPLFGAVVLLAAVMFLTDISRYNAQYLWRYAIAGAVAAGVMFLLAAPYILVASSGQAAYTPPSLMGDYYHNYAETNLLNTLRMAGNNGNGQSTLGYNLASATTIAGHILLCAMLLGGLVYSIKKAGRDYRAMVVGLLAILLGVLGFMHVLNTNTFIGGMVFESQWLVSTVRNPSKLFAIILPIFVILFGFSMQYFIIKARVPWQRVGFICLSVGLLALYGWPLLRGDFGLLFNREDKLAQYKRSDEVKAATEKVPPESRSLLMPSDHRDELNYQNTNPGFNILRLEGGLPNTSKMVDNINDTLNNRDPYFFNYLASGGVENIFIKKNEKSYKEALFSLFPVKISPEKARDFVASKTTLASENKYFWQFKNPSANPLVYSPKNIITMKGSSELKTKAPFLGKDTVVTDSVLQATGFATHYNVKPSLKNGEVVGNGKAQLHDPRLLLVDLYSSNADGKRYLMFDIIDPVSYTVSKTIQQEIPADGQVLLFGNERYTFSDAKKRVTMRAGDDTMHIASLEPVNLGSSDPSFEKPQTPGDATPQQDGKADIYSQLITDNPTHGAYSLKLGSKNHTGFVEKSLKVDDPKSQYMLQFDYQNLHGKAPFFAMLQDDQSLLFGGGRLSQESQWQRHEAYFQPIENAKDATIKTFFYTAPDTTTYSENAFDNMSLYKLRTTAKTPLSLPNYPSDYALKNYTYKSDEKTNTNLLTNPSFEDKGGWGNVGDATGGASGQPEIKAMPSSDAVHKKRSLQLESGNHTAYVAQEVSYFKPNSVYKLSFRYKHVSGRKPAFAIWQSGASIAQPSKELPADGDWNYFETYFVPDNKATNLGLYFYSRSSGEKTINLFDDVTLQPASLISNYLVKEEAGSQHPQPIVSSFKRLEPTLFSIQTKPGQGMVALNESFHKGWKAYVVPQTKAAVSLGEKLMIEQPGKEIKTHMMANGFANGWWVNSADYPEINGKPYTIVLRYEPQKTLYLGLISTALTALIAGGYLLYDTRKKRDTKGSAA